MPADDVGQRIIAMLAEGATFAEIARKLGVTRNVIAGKVYRMKRAGLLDGVERNRWNGGGRNVTPKPKSPRQRRRAEPKRTPPPSQQQHGSHRPGAAVANMAGARVKRYSPVPPRSLIDETPMTVTGPVALFDLQPHHCRWPVSDRPFLFCGERKELGSSYCAEHRAQSRRTVSRAEADREISRDLKRFGLDDKRRNRVAAAEIFGDWQ